MLMIKISTEGQKQVDIEVKIILNRKLILVHI